MNKLEILNPKRKWLDQEKKDDDSIFPYYAGYSFEFASRLLTTVNLPQTSLVLDPWNGGGTTTFSAMRQGLAAIGLDLNPVMVVVARARLLTDEEIKNVSSLLEEVVLLNKRLNVKDEPGEPLCFWFNQNTARYIRRIEQSICQILLGPGKKISETAPEELSSLAACFYVACFRVVRRLISSFFSTNPTWIKKAKNGEELLDFSSENLIDFFKHELENVLLSLRQGDFFERDQSQKVIKISVGNSAFLPLADNSVDAVLTSPPYCTRIDYAIATLPELAVLGFHEDRIDAIRRSLMGTSTVQKVRALPSSEWGVTCLKLLACVESHTSKASNTYYFKNLAQYFDSLNQSLKEIGRVLKPDGVAFIVVQDSYYKDVHIDLAKIVEEMLNNASVKLFRREDFGSKQTMVGLNPRAKKYKQDREPVESVLCFKKGISHESEASS